ncbi:MAG: SusC/RagA family TonB-linked outer membrane protein [Bacteroidota bacterium]
MKRFVFMLSLLLFVGYNLMAQGVQITGNVTNSEDGTALPGVSVAVKGTTVGTVTDFNGDYSLAVPANATTLVFSFVGMTPKEETIGGRTLINVELVPEAKALDEVVVTALGLSREKKALSYAVQDVSGDEISQAKETNIINSLQGRVAGAQITNTSGAVGASSRIILRGVTNLGANNQPLFVVDGIPISNDNFGGTGNEGTNKGNGAGDINPDDIASITILKGPNAAALYGSRASNGVIVITTKSGADKKALGVTVNNTTSFETPLRLPDFQNGYGQGSQGKFSFVDGAGGGTNDGTDESWGPQLDAGLMIPQYNSPVDEFGNREATPWVSQPNNIRGMFQTGVTTSTNVAMMGGNDKANFRLSYTQLNQKGMVPNTDYNKKTISWNASANPSSKLTISTSGQFVNANSGNMPEYGYSAENIMQQFMWSGRQVDYPGLREYTNPDGTKYNWNYNYHNNPWFTLYENLNTLDRDRFIGNAQVRYQITDWLSAYVRTGGDYYSNLSTYRRAVGDMDFPSGFYSENLSTYSETNSDFLFMFQKAFGEDFEVSLNAGGNRMDRRTQFNYGEASELAVPGVYNVKNSKVALVADNGKTLKRVNSLYAFGQIGFKRAIYLDFSLRNDWSSTLPDGNNSYLYPAVSASAVLTDLLDIQSNTLNFAKVRIGYAEVGGDTDPYSLIPTVAFGDGWNASTKLLNLAVPNNMPNAELRPQKTKSTEAGIEARLFASRVRANLTLYSSQSIDQIISIPVSPATGYTSKNVNAGRIDNKGIELELGLTPVQAGKFSWDININWALNRNEVVELADGIDQYQLGSYWSMYIMAIPGEKYGSLYGYDFARDDNGNIIYENGLPTQGDLKILGSYTPDWTGGISNEFRFGNLYMSALIDMRQGGDIYSMTTTWGRYAGVLEETLLGREGGIVGDGVMVGPDGSYVPNDVVVSAENFNKSAYVNDVAWSSVFDASYIKLREIRLGYTFDIKNSPVKDVNVSLVGRNLAILKTSVPHIDPETAFADGNVQGIEFGQLPSARSLGFNVSFKF